MPRFGSNAVPGSRTAAAAAQPEQRCRRMARRR